MKHLIILKWKENITEYDTLIDEIKQLFRDSTEINGIYNIKVYKNVIELCNRYDLMIEIEMEKDSLILFDNSKIHHIWKEKYSKYIQSKVIFDYEITI